MMFNTIFWFDDAWKALSDPQRVADSLRCESRLVDQFGRRIEMPPGGKVGDAVRVKMPRRFSTVNYLTGEFCSNDSAREGREAVSESGS